MSNVSFEVFLPRVMPEVIGCPEPTAIQSIRDAAIEFCEKTAAWQLDWTLDVEEGVNEYAIGLPSSMRCTAIQRAFYRNTPLKPMPADMALDADLYRETPTKGNSTPRFFQQKAAAMLSLLPTPNESASEIVTLRVAVQPSRDAATCDDSLYQDWAEVIAHGAKARLMASPGKPWTNPAFAAERGLFLTGINSARLRVAKARTRGQVRISIPRI